MIRKFENLFDFWHFVWPVLCVRARGAVYACICVFSWVDEIMDVSLFVFNG